MAAFEGWAVVELLGHRVRYGRVTEVTMFGEAFCRIEMPTDPATVEHYSGKALYGIREASEAQIRAYHTPRKVLTAPVLEGEVIDDDDGPTAAVRVDEDGDETWHASCARVNAEHLAAPADEAQEENPL